MNQSNTILTFIIVAFSLAIVIVLKKESIPQRIRKPLAVFSLCMILFAFFLIVYSFFTV